MTDTPDPRIVYGLTCTWWDSVGEATLLPLISGVSIPRCPICKGPLLEMEDEEEWMDGVRIYSKTVDPEYEARILWARGKCFPDGTSRDVWYKREQEKLSDPNRPEDPVERAIYDDLLDRRNLAVDHLYDLMGKLAEYD